MCEGLLDGLEEILALFPPHEVTPEVRPRRGRPAGQFDERNQKIAETVRRARSVGPYQTIEQVAERFHVSPNVVSRAIKAYL
jgi:DNA-binding MurR/RpiR family transcriptional regulator